MFIGGPTLNTPAGYISQCREQVVSAGPHSERESYWVRALASVLVFTVPTTFSMFAPKAVGPSTFVVPPLIVGGAHTIYIMVPHMYMGGHSTEVKRRVVVARMEYKERLYRRDMERLRQANVIKVELEYRRALPLGYHNTPEEERRRVLQETETQQRIQAILTEKDRRHTVTTHEEKLCMQFTQRALATAVVWKAHVGPGMYHWAMNNPLFALPPTFRQSTPPSATLPATMATLMEPTSFFNALPMLMVALNAPSAYGSIVATPLVPVAPSAALSPSTTPSIPSMLSAATIPFALTVLAPPSLITLPTDMLARPAIVSTTETEAAQVLFNFCKRPAAEDGFDPSPKRRARESPCSM